MKRIRLMPDLAAATSLAVATLLASAPLASVQAAADPTGSQPAPAGADHVLTEVVVTARLRKENLETVPISVSAFSGRNLRNLNVQNLSDLGNFTPGLTFNQGSSVNGGGLSADVFIRGVGQIKPFPTNDPAVGIYVDGVYYGNVMGSLMGVVDVDQVQVLRGPQGTLFGKNTLAGGIIITSKMPGDVLGGDFSVESGSYNALNARGSLNLPIVGDQLDARVTFSHTGHDGYDKSLATGRHYNDLDNDAGRMILDWKPSDALEDTLIGDVSREHDHGLALHPTAVNLSKTVVGLWNTSVGVNFPGELYGPQWITNDRDNYATGPLTRPGGEDYLFSEGVSNTIKWRISPETTLTSISAYRWLKTTVAQDQDGSPTPLAGNDETTWSTQGSEELRLAGTAFDSHLDWLTGFYFESVDLHDALKVRLADGLAPFGLNVTPDQNLFQTDRSFAGFTSDTWHFNDLFSITAGARYSYEAKDITASSINAEGGSVVVPPGTTNSAAWESTTPKVSLEFRPNKDNFLYVSYSQGFMSGGYDYVLNGRQDLDPYNPEKLATYEAGFKSTLWGHRLQINADVYDSELKQIQFDATVPAGTYTCPANTVSNLCAITINAGAGRTRGSELEVLARPIGSLTLSASAAYINAKFTSLAPLLASSHVATYATQFPLTPKWTYDVGGQYAFDLGGAGTLAAGLHYNFRSLTYMDLTNCACTSQPAYGLLNARITYMPLGEHWEFAVSGQNLTNKLYVTAGSNDLSSLGFASVAYGPPRVIMGSVRYKF
jgi:iron complex outermembrane receptor protein